MFKPKLYLPSNAKNTKADNSFKTDIKNKAISLLDWFGINLQTGDENKFLNQKGNWETVSGNSDNIFNSDGVLASNRTVTLDGKYLALGNNAIGEPTLVIGDLTAFGGDADSLSAVVGSVGLKTYISRGDGYFFEMSNDDDLAEAVFEMTQNPGGENVGSISVYDEDGFSQMGRVAAFYNKSTGEGYGMICMASDFDPNNRNCFAASNNFIRGRYYNSTTGELMSITIDDNGLKVDVDGDNAFNVDFDGQIGSESLAALNFADDTAAAAGGVRVNNFYHNNGALRIRLT